MSIEAGDSIHKFGLQFSVISELAPLTNGSFSQENEATLFQNFDDTPKATMVISVTFAAAPSANANIQLFGRPLNIRSTLDGNQPIAAFPHQYLGVFPMDTSQVTTVTSIEIELPNAKTQQEWEFYIKNNAGQTANVFEIWLRPLTVGPKV